MTRTIQTREENKYYLMYIQVACYSTRTHACRGKQALPHVHVHVHVACYSTRTRTHACSGEQALPRVHVHVQHARMLQWGGGGNTS